MAYKFKAFTEFDIRNQDTRLMIIQEGADGKRWAMQPPVFKTLEPGMVIDHYSFDHGGEEFLQAMLDHAWETGLRPKGFDDRTREVAAMEKHLDDMRHLVFKKNPLD